MIPGAVRQALVSKVRELLKEESNTLREIQEELKATVLRKTRTAGWKRQEARSRRMVDFYAVLLMALQTGCFNPPAGSALPRIVLRTSTEGILEREASLFKRICRKVVDFQSEIKSICSLWDV